MAPRVVLVVSAIFLSFAVLACFTNAASTLHADYLASSAEQAVRIANAQINGLDGQTLDVGTINANNAAGVNIQAPAGGFSIQAASTNIQGQIVGLTSSGSFLTTANNAIQIQSSQATISAGNSVSFSTSSTNVNVLNELKLQTTGSQSITGNSVQLNSGEGAVIVKSQQGALTATSDSFSASADNGLFVVGNSFAVNASDTFQASGQNVDVTANGNFGIQTNFNDVQINSNNQLTVGTQSFSATAASGIQVQAAQGEIFTNAGTTANAQAGNQVQITTEKLASLSSNTRIALTTQNTVLQSSQGQSFTVGNAGAVNLNSTTLTLQSNSFNLNIQNDFLIASEDKTITISSTVQPLAINGDVITFKGTQSDITLTSPIQTFSAPAGTITLGSSGSPTNQVTLSSKVISLSSATSTWISGTSTAINAATLTVSSPNEPTDKVLIQSSTSAKFTSTSGTDLIQGGSVSASGFSAFNWNVPSVTITNTGAGSALPTITFSANTGTTVTNVNSMTVTSGESFAQAQTSISVQSTATNTLTAQRDVNGQITGGFTLTSAGLLSLVASNGDMAITSTAATTITGNNAALTINTIGGLTKFNSDGGLQWVSSTGGLTATTGSITWNSTDSTTITAAANFVVSAASSSAQNWNGFSTVTSGASLTIGPVGSNFLWSSGVDQPISGTGTALTGTAAGTVRIASTEVQIEAIGAAGTLSATAPTIALTTPTSFSFALSSGGASSVTSVDDIVVASGGRSLITAGTTQFYQGTAVTLTATNSLAHLHSSGGKLSLLPTQNFLATSTQLAQVVSGGAMSTKSVGAFSAWLSANVLTVEGGALTFLSTGGGANNVLVSSTQQVLLSAPNNLASFIASGGGLSASGTNTLSVSTGTTGSIAIKAETTATYTSTAGDILVSGTTSVNEAGQTQVASVATASTRFIGGSISLAAGSAGLTVTGGTGISVTSAEDLPIVVQSTGGILSLVGTKNVAVTSNEDLSILGTDAQTYTATNGFVSIGSSGEAAATILASAGDSTFTAKNSLTLTVLDRSFNARDITITSAGDTVQKLSTTAANTAPASAFSILSNGAAFDNQQGAQVGIVLRTSASTAPVTVTSGAGFLAHAAQGASYISKSSTVTITSTAGSTSFLATGNNVVFTANGALKVNTDANSKGALLIGSTGTLTPDGAPLVAEASGTMSFSSGTTMSFVSNTGARGVEVLSDNGHITLTTAAAAANTFTNTAGGNIYIEAGDATSISTTGGSITYQSTTGNVQMLAQSGFSLTSTKSTVTDLISVTSGLVSVSSSLHNDLALNSGATQLKSTSTAGATIVRSGLDWALGSTTATTALTSTTGVVSVGSAGSVSIESTNSAGAGITVQSTTNQFWTARDEMVFDPITSATVGTPASPAIVHITAGGDSQKDAVLIQTTGAVSVQSTAAGVDLSAADRFVHTNQAGGVVVKSTGGVSLTSFGTTGVPSDVIIAAGNKASFVSADTLALGASGAVSITSAGGGGISVTAANNILLQTFRSSQIYAQQSTAVVSDSWPMHAGGQINWASDDLQQYQAGTVTFTSLTSSVYEANNGITMALQAPNAAQTDIVFSTAQRDSAITFYARDPTSNFVSTSVTASTFTSGLDLSVIGNGGVVMTASTSFTSSAAADFVLESSDDVSIITRTGIVISSAKPQPGSDVIVSAASRLHTSSPSADTLWTAGTNGVTGVTQGTNQIAISADNNVSFRTVPLLGGSISFNSALASVPLHIEVGRNSVVRSGLDWTISSGGQLQVSTDGLPTSEGFGMRWTSTGAPTPAAIQLKSTNNAVVVQGVRGVQVDAGFVILNAAGTMNILAQGPTGISIESTEPASYISFSSPTPQLHTIVAFNGSVAIGATGTQPQTGWISASGVTGKFESSTSTVTIDSQLSNILLSSAAATISTVNGPIRFTATGAEVDSGLVSMNFAASRDITATSAGDVNVRSASVTFGSIQDTLGFLRVSAGAELQVIAEGDNANGNAIEIISQDSTSPVNFNCGSQFQIEAGGIAEIIGDRGIYINAQDSVGMTSFTNITFTGSAKPQINRIASVAIQPFAQTAVYVNTVASAGAGESIQFYSGSDSIIESAHDIVAYARTSLVYESGGEMLFSSSGPISFTAGTAASSVTTVADIDISSSRDLNLAADSLTLTAQQATFLAQGQTDQPGSGDLRFTATGDSTTSMTFASTGNIFLGTGEPVVVAPGSRLVIPISNGVIACSAANDRAFYFNSLAVQLCFCANGAPVCKALV